MKLDSNGVIPHRIETIRTHQARGGRVAAVLPIHYPRALLRAFDILPVEVWGPPQVDATRGHAHLQPYVCSIARNALAYLLNGGLDLADMIVVPHACDTLQGFASILIDFVHPVQPVLPIYLPRGRRESDLVFLVDEFKSLYQQLAEITGRTPSKAELTDCIRREEEADARLLDMYRNRAAFMQMDFYGLVRSREYLPAETFVEIVDANLHGRPKTGGYAGLPQPKIPIILSGIVPEPMVVFDALGGMNAAVVADDFAGCGRRQVSPFSRAICAYNG